MMVADYQVVAHEEIAKNIYEITLRHDPLPAFVAGQFVHVKVDDTSSPLLRRPLSVARIDVEDATITLIYRSGGLGTNRLTKKQVGDTVNVLGPLGNGFMVDQVGSGDHAVLVGGGVGIPPLYELAKQLNERGVRVTTILGFQDKDTSFYVRAFSKIADVYVTSDDGSIGIEGNVSSAWPLIKDPIDWLFACGPKPMLKACVSWRNQVRKASFVSLEERMGCGIGACLACVCETTQGQRKVCSDGPVFTAEEVCL
ncbi:dihydroorotate dehydrogenase electron transfer subunit [Texcoconibacillus texcoconensis]|uniref:Dihydroorotate dehydrogenase B (NAD(+)), electron transfer subunit n=1 Tax=Texcoconibacillus texcoconensis TaxID=1095777 RepID=A0A840QLA3_9BACI|nr:dihydroorotate dehydrogenase electron transfer subunit [Texcoconibacillus texcoconensis]MBB5172144.1 dihydroorotate dehydrogenase electron transfer subunit [Texcoconibacillus texcoconensis]